MRKSRNKKSRPSLSQKARLRKKAQRHREIERLEERQMLSVNFADDPLFQDQWHLKANGQLVEQPNSPTFLQSQARIDINVLGAWDLGFDGSGVQVAVVDGAFDLNHPDLVFVTDLTDPSGSSLLDIVELDAVPAYEDVTDGHGTAVAGLIGARDNDVGGIGVAPNVDLIPIRLIPGDFDAPPVNVDPNLAAQLEFLQFAGVPQPGDDGSNASQVVDIYNRSYGRPNGFALLPQELEALRTAATLGRGTWIDQDGDGVFEVEEIEALGAININAAGNSGGADHDNPAFQDVGIYASSQYNGLANRFTITVGTVDFGGDYTNPETGSRGSWAEAGANVLVVAPTQTFGIGIGLEDGLIGGQTTTDLSGNDGEDGYNGSPVFGQELDDDFLPDINYTSTFGGTSGAAPLVSGVAALMLDANPKLSYRDVQQILLMSAQQIDQFDESWIVNAYQYFEGVYDTPNGDFNSRYGTTQFANGGLYSTNNIDVDGDGTNELTGVLLSDYSRLVNQNIFYDPNAGPDQWGGFANQAFYVDEEGNTRYYFPELLTSAFGFGSYLRSTNDVSGLISNSGVDPQYLTNIVGGTNLTNFNNPSRSGLFNPISGQNKGVSDDTVGPFSDALVNNELRFENGVGFTVSWGIGDYLEEYGYAHGNVDAELAVQLALAWEAYDLYLEDQVTITSSIQNQSLRVQGKTHGGVNGPFEIPGGVHPTAEINPFYYGEFLQPITYANVPDGAGGFLGSAISSAPFYDGPGDEAWRDGPVLQTKADSRVAIPIDPNIMTDFMSVEWLEFTAQVSSGNLSGLRVSLLSPDGTQSELNAYRHPTDAFGDTYQQPQSQQGVQVTNEEILDESFGGTTIVNATPSENGGGIDFTTAFIDGQEDYEVSEINLTSPVGAGQTWTWSTNRHWGEIFSTESQNQDVQAGTVDGQWYIVLENWNENSVTFSGEYEVAVHGVEVTGNRIQGKIGVDDNAQAREDQNSDEVFNFDRYVTFGQVDISTLTGGNKTIQVVLDDATDSVHYNNNYYETVDETTGQPFRYAVVDSFEYAALAEITKGTIGADQAVLDALTANTGQYFSAYTAAEVQEWYLVYGEKLNEMHPGLFEANPGVEVDGLGNTVEVDALGQPTTGGLGESILGEEDINIWRQNLLDIVVADIVAAETFEPQLNYGAEVGTTELTPATDSSGFVMTYQNFDFNQETFASNVVVQATQFVKNYDAAGNELPRVATGVVDYAITGADGNYWFDVAANPEPPNPLDFVSTAAYQAAYDQWFNDFGKVYEYEISIVNSEFQDRIIDKDYSSEVNMLREASGADSADVDYGAGSIDYQMGQRKYNVPIFASPDLHKGQATTIKDVNFLMTVDPALTQVTVTGDVYRDQDGDDNFDSTESGVAGAVVYHDDNGNGILDAGEASGTVNADGSYSFVISGITSTQDIVLTIDPTSIPSTLEFLNPNTGSQTVEVTPGTTPAFDFTLQRLGGEPALVQGFVFNDVNQSGTLDAGEIGISASNAVTVYIDYNGNGILDTSGANPEPSALTQADGTFSIESEIGGSYDVRIDDSTPLTITSPASGAIPVTVVVGEVISDLQFGVYDSRTQDFGDLEGYPTLLSEDGARHVVMDGVYLGSRVDIDSDGMPTSDARGDDFTGVNDDDGVFLLSDITAGNEFDIQVTASGEGASLNAWIDFNNDGDWDDAGEQIFDDLTLILDQRNILTVMAPADVDPTATQLAARFRWGPFGLSYDGPANSGEVEDYLLAVETPVNIRGEVRNDTDGDAVFDATDAPVEGVIVYYDANLDGVRQEDEVSSITNAIGEYQIAISTDSAIDVTLRIDESSLQGGENFVSPIDGIFSQTVTPGLPVTANFLVGFPQGIQGLVFGDDDNNGARAAGETGFANVPVMLYEDTDNNGVYETLVGSTISDISGNYNIPVAIAGQYELRIDLSDFEFHSQSTPDASGQIVTINANSITTAPEFGVYNATLGFTADYGDLLGYPTLASENGPSHTVVSGIHLGSSIDADPGTLANSNATADDNSLADDEDGVVLVSDQIVTNSTLEIDVTATGSGVVMNAWIDFNDDGDWDDTGEQILLDRALTSGATTRVVIDTTDLDINTSASALAARFRWGTPGIGYTGIDSQGEVEDYLLPTSSIEPVVGDFDGNGTVGQSDYDMWVANYGSTINLEADANNNGVVDIADYTVWRDAMEAPAAAMAPVPPADETIYVTPVTYEPSFAAASFAPLTASPEESLELEAAVLMGGSQDESFAIESALASEGPVQEGSVDEALLLIDGSILSENEETEFSTFDSEEQEDEEALLEALSSF